MKPDTGGPAFPNISPAYDEQTKETYYHTREPGLTVRDYFAAKAMAALLGAIARNYAMSRIHEPEVATSAYWMADAMLKERNRGQE